VTTLQPFWYELPDHRIAQRPVYPPESAKLLIVEREAGKLSVATFAAIPQVFRSGDLLCCNDSRVVKCRLLGKFEDGDTEIELLLVTELERGVFRCMGRPLKRFRPGRRMRFGDGLTAEVIERVENEFALVRFPDAAAAELTAQIDRCAVMPIPPYIRGGKADTQDEADYQTIFAATPGSIAAPTASLHFTPALVSEIRGRGVTVDFVTLHVGTASFRALYESGSDVVTSPETERFRILPGCRANLQRSRSEGGRIFALGTTVCRALETLGSDPITGGEQDVLAETELFIRPGHTFRWVDALITNFHQPGSSHLLLVEAFLGRRLLEEVYAFALENEFRFLSYGDGMVVI
jgi:S-adenosylmethionine:tRNA ribosyltransferase-isomerase